MKIILILKRLEQIAQEEKIDSDLIAMNYEIILKRK
jgi:hypothetical protein